MSSFTSQNDFPRFSEIDHAAEAAAAAAEAYDRAVSAQLNQEAIAEYFLDLVGTALMEGHNALADMRTLLTDAPLQDGYDLQQWSRIGQPSDASLAHLAEVERVKGQLGDVAF